MFKMSFSTDVSNGAGAGGGAQCQDIFGWIDISNNPVRIVKTATYLQGMAEDVNSVKVVVGAALYQLAMEHRDFLNRAPDVVESLPEIDRVSFTHLMVAQAFAQKTRLPPEKFGVWFLREIQSRTGFQALKSAA